MSLASFFLQHGMYSLLEYQDSPLIIDFSPCISDYGLLTLEQFDAPFDVTPHQDAFKVEPPPAQPRPAYSGSFSHDNICIDCGKIYKQWGNLSRHQKYECGVLPRFMCFYCPHRSKRRAHMESHILLRHKDMTMRFHVDPEP